MFKTIGLLGIFSLAILLLGCGRTDSTANDLPTVAKEAKMAWPLTSTAFADNTRIPDKYTGEGKNVSPPLNWGEPPAGTVEYALICNDPDAPAGNWIHWVLYGLGKERRSLPEGLPKTKTLPDLGEAKQGINTGRQIGYSGPMPPPGKLHHYHFRLYALKAPIALAPGATEAELKKALQGHILAETELVGLYSR